MLKSWGSHSTFWSTYVEKLHAAVARSAFPSENAKELTVSEHFLTFRCPKLYGPKLYGAVARSALSGENAQNCQVRTAFRSSDVEKMCTPLWRQARFQVKVSEHFLKFRCRKIARRCGDKRVFKSKSRSIFWSSDVEKLHAAVARSTWVSQNAQNTCVLAHCLKFRCRNSQSASWSISQVVN